MSDSNQPQEMGMKAVVFNIQKFSLHDGDGIRTTIFFKGCPLSCKWCHNPEGQNPRPQLVIYPERCRHCGRCGQACPEKSSRADGRQGVCTACGCCAAACFYNAREIAGKFYSPEELIRIAEQDTVFYETSGGGITLSGGEVMTQDRDFLLTLVSGLKQKGLNIAIDTCGFAPFESFEKILPYIDTFLYDIKLIDRERHKLFTGCDNDLILSNLMKLSERGAKNIHIRIPVIEGVNADEYEMDAIIRYLTDVRVEKISLLPYHDIGRDKYPRICMNMVNDSFTAPNSERMCELADKFKQKGFLTVLIGG